MLKFIVLLPLSVRLVHAISHYINEAIYTISCDMMFYMIIHSASNSRGYRIQCRIKTYADNM